MLSANYYFQMSKKSDVERYLQKYDVKYITIIFNKAWPMEINIKLLDQVLSEALVKIQK